MFKHITIKTRLIFVIAFLAAELIIGATVGIVNLGTANAELKNLYDNRLVALGQISRVVQLITTNQMNVAKAVSATDAAQRDALLAEVDSNIGVVTTTWKAYEATELTAEEAALASKFVEARKAFLEKGLNPALAAVRAGDTARAVELLTGEMSRLFQPVSSLGNQLIDLQNRVAKADYEHSQSTYELVRLVCLAGLAFGLVMAALVGWLLVRAIVRPIERAVEIAGEVASGDLTQKIEVDSRDETGRLLQALKDMNASLVKIVTQVRGGTDTIATASGEIAAGNLDLSSRTEQQAGSLEETASSMEELTSTVKQNADNARQANVLAASAQQVAGKGGEVVEQVVKTMGAINSSATRIVDIIAVIDGIAFQTNILALNAAVEAARAGEQGRGFAVVAGEVRNLAQRSAAAAKEIKELIDDSVEKVHHGSELVDQAGATMAEIVQSVGRVTDIISEISAASQEQTAGIEQINSAVTQMDQVTQQNAALVEEASAAAQALQEEARALAQAVGTFRLDVSGAPAVPAAVAKLAKPQARIATSPAAKPAAKKAVKPATKAAQSASSAAKGQARGAKQAQPVDATEGWEEF
ncbi:methyl-accepting chemotaxis protein [Massilia sp. G4R7]|uniref:Methyl-accepting chemotaxis protein n=1 Tax=Massilia phyllostachyos TaxID=2898585 RepID=A0ABS8QBT2_9BURK|nr:methyl-accepting chemotaxis protein [Massilia phyllostachyos]MCD2519225.1 methyl-accepting chemotaxis protein [Massilia phyllostachyos]